MRLTKIFDQAYKNIPSRIESGLVVVVDYDPKTDEVTEIIDVYGYNMDTKITTPLDQILVQQIPAAIETIIRSVNWRELYRELKADKKAA